MKKAFLLTAFTVSTFLAGASGIQHNSAEAASSKIADCTITVKNNKTGDSYTITVHGQSCGELIKQIMK